MNKLGDLSCKEFLTELASAAPAPGGGGGAAMAGALAAALASMVANLTIGKEKFADREPEVKELLEQAEAERVRLLTLVEEDAAVFNSFMSCYKLPKTTDEEKVARTAAIRAAAKQAATVPLNIARIDPGIFPLRDDRHCHRSVPVFRDREPGHRSSTYFFSIVPGIYDGFHLLHYFQHRQSADEAAALL